MCEGTPFRSCPPRVASIVVGLRQSRYTTVRLLLLLHWASSIKQGEWANTLKNNNHPANNQSHNGAHIMAPLYTLHEKKNNLSKQTRAHTHIYKYTWLQERKCTVLNNFYKNWESTWKTDWISNPKPEPCDQDCSWRDTGFILAWTQVEYNHIQPNVFHRPNAELIGTMYKNHRSIHFEQNSHKQYSLIMKPNHKRKKCKTLRFLPVPVFFREITRMSRKFDSTIPNKSLLKIKWKIQQTEQM